MGLQKRIDTDPKGFAPYDKVIICGLILLNVKYLIEVNGNHPVLIGVGKKPRIWIFAPKNDKLNKWVPIFKDSRGLVNEASIVETGVSKQNVMLGSDCLFHIEAYNHDSIIIESMNLRPIGFDVVGNKDHIMAGGTKISGFRVEGATTLLSLS